MVRQFITEGKTDIEIDFTMSYLKNNALHWAKWNETLADSIVAAVKDGWKGATFEEAEESANRYRREASFIRKGLEKIFPKSCERK